MTAESAPYAKGQRATQSSAARRPRLTSRYGFSVPGSWIMGMALPDTCGICPFHRFAISFSAFCVSPFRCCPFSRRQRSLRTARRERRDAERAGRTEVTENGLKVFLLRISARSVRSVSLLFAVAHSRGDSGRPVRRAGEGELHEPLDEQNSHKTS